MAPHLFLAPGSGVAVEVQSQAKQPASDLGAANRQTQLRIRELERELASVRRALDLETGIRLGNFVIASIYGR